MPPYAFELSLFIGFLLASVFWLGRHKRENSRKTFRWASPPMSLPEEKTFSVHKWCFSSRTSLLTQIYTVRQLLARKRKNFLAFDFPCMCRFSHFLFFHVRDSLNQHKRNIVGDSFVLLTQLPSFRRSLQVLLFEAWLRLCWFHSDIYLLNAKLPVRYEIGMEMVTSDTFVLLYSFIILEINLFVIVSEIEEMHGGDAFQYQKSITFMRWDAANWLRYVWMTCHVKSFVAKAFKALYWDSLCRNFRMTPAIKKIYVTLGHSSEHVIISISSRLHVEMSFL
jgi:hypothetical protein